MKLPGFTAVRAVLVAATLVVGSVIVHSATRAPENAGALAAARRQIAELRDEVALADIRNEVVEGEVAKADAERLQTEARAEMAERKLSVLRQHFQVAASEAADTCAPVIAAGEAALDEANETIAVKDSALVAGAHEIAIARAGLDSVRKAFGRLAIGAWKVDSTVYVATKRPSLARRLLPDVGIGGAIGVGEDKRPHTVAGLTLGWKL